MTTKTTIQLTSTFTDTTLPKDRIDPVLPDAGALYLWDAAHPAGPQPAGVPAQSSAMPNIAWQQAAAMIGSGDATTLSMKALLTTGAGAYGTGGLSLLERTAKGGIHSITSQASDPGTVGFGISLADPLMTYVLGNSPEHFFYWSVWTRTTRSDWAAPVSAGKRESYLEISNGSSGSSNYLAGIFNAGNAKGASGNAGRAPADGQAVGPFLSNVVSKEWTGTEPATAAQSQRLAAVIGAGVGAYQYTAGIRQSKASRIVYRVYAEDLTVSGRTYSQVDALDLAQYTKDMITAGGRYVGDTFTAPSTIP